MNVLVFILWLLATLVFAFGAGKEWRVGHIGIATLNAGFGFWALIQTITVGQSL
jgi:hypothetical protein